QVEFSHTLLLYRAINLLRIKSRAARFYDSLTSDKTPPPHSTFLTEGTRSLRTVILIRHLQRILYVLPAAQIPKTDSGSSAIPVVNSRFTKI
ncbi:MAG: hypothetical protein NXY57DRAFT_942272, partial [Lentinula lateritia]